MAVVLGVPVLQGYGLTETCAGGTICHPEDRTYGRCGMPLPCCELKLVDVPDMGYKSTDTDEFGNATPRGEICIRGGNVTLGYFQNPQATAEVYVEAKERGLDEKERGVWFYTGDVGKWNLDGTLSIIDRKKDLVKLKHGEYIALGKLESIFRQSPYVENICIHADSKRSAAVAIVVPNEANAIKFAQTKNLDTHDLAKLYQNPALIAEVKASMNKEGDKAKIQKFEQLGDFILTTTVWSADNSLLTDALKIKRNEIYKHHREDTETMYKRFPDD